MRQWITLVESFIRLFEGETITRLNTYGWWITNSGELIDVTFMGHLPTAYTYHKKHGIEMPRSTDAIIATGWVRMTNEKEKNLLLIELDHLNSNTYKALEEFISNYELYFKTYVIYRNGYGSEEFQDFQIRELFKQLSRLKTRSFE